MHMNGKSVKRFKINRKLGNNGSFGETIGNQGLGERESLPIFPYCWTFLLQADISF